MQSGSGQLGLLQRIDRLTEELQLLRREVADLLVREAEASAMVESVAAVAESDVPLTGISSLEELYSRDFDKKEEGKVELPTELEQPMDELLATVEPEADLNDLFVLSGSDEALERAFEPALHFNLIDHLTIADKFLFANELCFGNQGDLMEMLGDIERLSSWSQVESYLYQVRGFRKEEEAVKLLAAFIKEHSK